MSFSSVWRESKGFRVFVITMIVLFIVSIIGIIVALCLSKKYTRSTTKQNKVEPNGKGEYIIEPPKQAETFTKPLVEGQQQTLQTKTKASNNSYLLNYINNS